MITMMIMMAMLMMFTRLFVESISSSILANKLDDIIYVIVVLLFSC